MIEQKYETHHKGFACRYLLMAALLAILLVPKAVGQGGGISTSAYNELISRTSDNRNNFFVYRDQDSGSNHGFPSGIFPTGNGVTINTGCVDDPNSSTGCSTNSNALDQPRGTVLSVTFASIAPGSFLGLNIEEPEDWGQCMNSTCSAAKGYNLTGAANVVVQVRSPNAGSFQFGVGGCKTGFIAIPQTWTTETISLSNLSCTPDLTSVHLLFAIILDDMHGANGGAVLLNDIHFDPLPTAQQTALGFPAANQTFGVVPVQAAQPGRVPISPDQILRNLSPVYEAALTEIALIARGNQQDIPAARIIADTLDYALHNDNNGDLLPVASDGSVGLHSAYISGDVAFFNDQLAPKQGKQGNIRLAGFTATTLCPTSGFCLVLDGATGGNDAFAILALLAAFQQFNDTRYLNDARTIGFWIKGELTDTSGTGLGGYFFGFQDGTAPPKPLQTNKSVENNADIFAAFSALAQVESQLGNTGEAAMWTSAANVAGDFVMQMFDSTNGRFNSGTVPAGTPPSAGICPTTQQKGNDVITNCDFLDANTFTTLALAPSPRYRNQINWCGPIQFVLNNFSVSVTVAGQAFNGLDLVTAPVSGPNGVAWEFTGQEVEALQLMGALFPTCTFSQSASFYLNEIQHAQSSAPFADGQGIVAATIQDGDLAHTPPIDECLSTPFQCIAERVGLAATAWGIFAEKKLNPFFPFPAVALSSRSVTFAKQLVGTSSTAQTVTLFNPGTLALTISGITPTGDFSVTNSCGTMVPAGGSCPLSIVFGPTSSGSRTGTIAVASNGSAAPQVVNLSGTGTDFSVSASNSGNVSPGESIQLTATLAPIAGYAGSVLLKCDATSIAAGATCVGPSNPVSLASGPATATLTVNLPTVQGNTSNAGSFSVAVQGNDSVFTAVGHSTSTTLQVSDFSLPPNGSLTQTVVAGMPATYPIMLASQNGFSGPASFSCTAGLPPSAACNFAPQSITLPGQTTTTLTITTPAKSASLPVVASIRGFVGVLLFALFLSTAGIVAGRTQIGKGRLLISALGCLTLLSLLVSCGGGGGSMATTPTPTPVPTVTTSTISVQVSSGGDVKTMLVTLIVKSN